MPEKFAALAELPWDKIAAVVGGAGASALVASQVQKVAPQVSVEMAGAGTGLAMILVRQVRDLHPLVPYLGLGLIAGSLMPRVSGWLGGILPKVGLPAGGTGAPSTAYDAAKAYIGG